MIQWQIVNKLYKTENLSIYIHWINILTKINAEEIIVINKNKTPEPSILVGKIVVLIQCKCLDYILNLNRQYGNKELDKVVFFKKIWKLICYWDLILELYEM